MASEFRWSGGVNPSIHQSLTIFLLGSLAIMARHKKFSRHPRDRAQRVVAPLATQE